MCIEEKERRVKKSWRKVAARSEFYISEQICSLKTKQTKREKCTQLQTSLSAKAFGLRCDAAPEEDAIHSGSCFDMKFEKKYVACHCAKQQKKHSFRRLKLAFIKYIKKKSNFKGNRILRD